MNKYQKVITQITKIAMKNHWRYRKTTFKKLRAELKEDTKDLDFDELVIYKNLG